MPGQSQQAVELRPGEGRGFRRGLDLDDPAGIIPALESSHALAYALKRKEEDITILVSLSGRGDKDIDHVRRTLDEQPELKLPEDH